VGSLGAVAVGDFLAAPTPEARPVKRLLRPWEAE